MTARASGGTAPFGPAPVGGPSTPTPPYDRRFEAIVMWCASPAGVPPTAAVGALRHAGVLVGVIAPMAVRELSALLAEPGADGAELLLADSGGSGSVVVDETGMHQVPGRATRTGAPDDGAPDRAGPPGGRADGVVLETLQGLWRLGVDPADVLLVLNGPLTLPEWPGPAPGPGFGDVTALRVNGGRTPRADGALSVTGGAARLRRLLADQVRRRHRHSLPNVVGRSGWSLTLEGFDDVRERVHGALLTLADGHLGSTGALLTDHPGRDPSVVAAGVYDGDGPGTRLLTGPRTFQLTPDAARGDSIRRVLDLRTGVLHERSGVDAGTIESVRFASLAQPSLSVLRARHPVGLRTCPPLLPPPDDPVFDQGRSTAAAWIRIAGSTGGIVAAATQDRTRIRGSRHAVLDRRAAYRADGEGPPDPGAAVASLAQAEAAGFDRLLARHRRTWAGRWEDADVVVEGDDELQLAVRFALFHLMASVGDTGEAGVGARGLTGTGYRGHVFWDADTFVLPFLAATHPASARAMLEYRWRRLQPAMDAARAQGRSGARFPWESAHAGGDVTPTSTRDRAGRIVEIRTGALEEHIVAQVPWAACCYVDWSGDEGFARGPGRRILIETARYWTSRIYVGRDGAAHLYGVIGPDEYHECVDDNAFTNVMARWNLRRAAGVTGGDDLEPGEPLHWLELADALVDGYDADTGVYEQFAGFSRLEPLIIEEVAPRRPIAADVLLGAERVAGSQVLKQADVLLLHHLVPDEVEPGSLEPNLRFYEPRTAHGSSLSPATHALVEARARDYDRALASLRLAARLDLDDLTGSTAGGLHLATMGGLWQAMAFGFGGLRPRAGRLHIDPVLPPTWSAYELRVQFRGRRVHVRKGRDRLTVDVDGRTPIAVGGTPYLAGPGTLAFRRRGSHWEAIT